MMPGKRPKTPTEPPVRENLTPAEEQLRRDTNWQLDLNEAGEALFGDRPVKAPVPAKAPAPKTKEKK
jgi:hypothetical protein